MLPKLQFSYLKYKTEQISMKLHCNQWQEGSVVNANKEGGEGIELQIFLEVESPTRNQGESGFGSLCVPFLKCEAGRRLQLTQLQSCSFKF